MSFIKKIIIFSTISLMAVVLTVIFGIAPLFFGIKELANKIIVEKKSVLSFEEEAKIANQFEKNYENLELNPKSLDNFLASSDAPLGLIKFFESMAKESNLSIDIYPSSIVKLEKDPWDSIGFNLELTGDFLSFLKFLEKIENSNYFIQAQKIQTRKVALTKNIKAVLNIKVFVK